MNVIKTPLKNLLENNTLSSLMYVSINFEKLGLDPITFIDMTMKN